MPLPFNPMSFVTPYTALSTGNAGKDFMDSLSQARQSKVSEGYLQNAQRQQAVSEDRYGQQELDKARSQLDAAMLSGNSDMADAALHNLKAIASRYGLSIAETRSSAALDTSVKDKVGQQKAISYGSGTKEDPYDADAPGFADSAEPPNDGSDDNTNAAANERINQALVAEKAAPFTGMRPPGGSLPPVAPGAPAAPAIRTPGGSLPALETAGVGEAPLRGYTLLGKDGKPMYTVAPHDVEMRQRKRVEDVFASLAEKTQDPQELQWLQQSQAAAGKLVGTMPLEEAVKTGLQLFTERVQGAQKLAIVGANKKSVGGGGGAGSGYAVGREGQAQRALTDDAWSAVNNTMTNYDIKGLNKTDNGLANAEGGLSSTNPASQRGAIRNILKAMSGLTVNATEEAGYQRLNGLADQARNMLSQLTGDEMSPSYVAAVKQMLQEWRAETARIRTEAGRKAADAYLSFAPKAPDDVLQGQADGIYRYFTGGGTAGGGAPKYKPPEERGTGGKTPGKSLLEK